MRLKLQDLLLENGRHNDVVLLWCQHQRLSSLTTLNGEQLQKPAKFLEGFLRVEVVDGDLNVKPRPDVTVECHLKLLHATQLQLQRPDLQNLRISKVLRVSAL